MARARVVVLLIDGLGDVSVPSLGQRTPLQSARTSTLDALAAAGVNGLLDPVAPGLACGSDTAHLSLLGYDPRRCYRGRGAFESMGAGLDMDAGDVAFKCNFAVVDDATRLVTSRRADRHFEQHGRARPAQRTGKHGLAVSPHLSLRADAARAQRCCAPRWTGCSCRRWHRALAATRCPYGTPRSTARASSSADRASATASRAQARPSRA